MKNEHKQEVVNALWLIKKALDERGQHGFFWGNRLNELIDKHPEYLLEGSPVTSQGTDILFWAMVGRGESRLDAILAEFEEYDEWSDALAEQETLLTADEYYSTLDEQDYEAELNYVRTAGHPI